MATPEELQFLGAALIILSIVLIYCWYTSKKNSEGLRNIQTSYTTLSKPITYADINRVPEDKTDSRTPSMQDLENFGNPKYELTKKHKGKVDFADARWNVDGMVASSDPTDQILVGDNTGDPMNYAFAVDSPYVDKLMNLSNQQPREAVTPLKRDFVDSAGCKSVSGSVLTLTDYSPQYFDRTVDKGYISI
jgi:hypothetical protein